MRLLTCSISVMKNCLKEATLFFKRLEKTATKNSTLRTIIASRISLGMSAELSEIGLKKIIRLPFTFSGRYSQLLESISKTSRGFESTLKRTKKWRTKLTKKTNSSKSISPKEFSKILTSQQSRRIRTQPQLTCNFCLPILILWPERWIMFLL